MRSPSLPQVVRVLVEPFADRLLAIELPGLPPERRQQAVAFCARRIADIPAPMRLGVIVIAATMRVAFSLTGGAAVGVAARRPVPLVGEYVRLLRSLSYAFVWETWADTAPDGSPRLGPDGSPRPGPDGSPAPADIEIAA